MVLGMRFLCISPSPPLLIPTTPLSDNLAPWVNVEGSVLFLLELTWLLFTHPVNQKGSLVALLGQAGLTLSLITRIKVFALRTASYAWNVSSPQCEAKPYTPTHTPHVYVHTLVWMHHCAITSTLFSVRLKQNSVAQETFLYFGSVFLRQ